MVYAILYLLLFIQFPLAGALPGNTDTLLSISMTNVFNEQVMLFLRGVETHTIMFPAKNFLAYGENCFGLGFVFTFYKILLRNDHWAYYFFLSTLFTLNSYSLFHLTRLYVDRYVVSLASGIVLPLSIYFLANIDDPNCIFIFFPVLSICSLLKGCRTKSIKHVQVGMLLAGIQIWFGMYVFVFNIMALSLIVLGQHKRLLHFICWRNLWTILLPFVLASLPIMLLYYLNLQVGDLVSPYENPLSRKLSSLHFYNFWNVLPNNLIYSAENNITVPEFDSSLWYSLRKTCFPGFIFSALTLLGVICSRVQRKTWLAVFFIFLILSFGTTLFEFELISSVPLGNYFRVASRAYLFSLLALTVFFAIGMEKIVSFFQYRFKLRPALIALAVVTMFLIENLSFPLLSYHYGDMLFPKDSYTNFFRNFNNRKIILDLPSDYRARLPQEGPIWTYSRDALYMNWQSYHKQIILGGINGYLPASRLVVDELSKNLPKKDAIDKLKEIGLEYLVFHKQLVLFPGENILNDLKGSTLLNVEFEDDEIAVVKIK